MTVQNIALIEQTSISFSKGMLVLSGETGAGKSIIIDSLNLVLGSRADRTLIRAGCEKAFVEALFDISKLTAVKEMLDENSLEVEGDLLSIRREITITERNICRVAGVIVPLTLLKKLSGLLVDVHGQHDHQSLLDEKQHMQFLDAFGTEFFVKQKEQTCLAYNEFKESSKIFSTLRKEEARREEREVYLKNRIENLNKLDLTIGEKDKLSKQYKKMQNAEKIDTSMKLAYVALTSDREDKCAISACKDALSAISNVSNLSDNYQKMHKRLTTIFYELEELSLDLKEEVNNSVFDEYKFETIETRLDQITKLEKKYSMSADSLILYQQELEDEYSHLNSLKDRLKTAENNFKSTLQAYRLQAKKLTELRKEIADNFTLAVEKELNELGMKKTTFACVFEKEENSQLVKPTPLGDDTVHFYISANVGEPLKPLNKIASGGELSRIMLALKTIAAKHDGVPTMVFDEIDTGISGQIAGVVAEKMSEIGKYHQVLCITHQAQIAAKADVQYLVEKNEKDGRMLTEVIPLNNSQRIVEVARLLGVTNMQQESGIAHAKSLLNLQ